MHGKSYHTSTIATTASSSFICLLKCASYHYLKNVKTRSMFTPKDCAQASLWICDELLQPTARTYLLLPCFEARIDLDDPSSWQHSNLLKNTIQTCHTESHRSNMCRPPKATEAVVPKKKSYRSRLSVTFPSYHIQSSDSSIKGTSEIQYITLISPQFHSSTGITTELNLDMWLFM